MDTDLLKGSLVVEIGEMVAAPYAGRVLRLLGAEVVKIESRGGDASRNYGPFPEGRVEAEASALFAYLNAGKQSVLVDPTDLRQLRALERLVSRADVVVAGYDTGGLKTWELEPDIICARYPNLVFVTVTPLGNWSDEATPWPACDLDACSMAAVTWVIGEPGREPIGLPFCLADYQAGVHAAGAAVAALLGTQLGRPGQHIEIATADVLGWYSGTNSMIYEPYGIPWARAGRRASGSGGPYPYGLFECKDGLVCLIARSVRDWTRFLESMGNPEWSQNARYQDQSSMGRVYPDEVDALVKPLLSLYTRMELLNLARKWGYPLAPLLTIAEVVNHPHLVQRAFFEPGQVGGSSDIVFPGSPFRIGERPGKAIPPAPALGANTREILGGS